MWFRLFVPVGHSATRKVIWRQLALHPIAFQYSDIILTHLPREVREYLMAVLEQDPERRIREHFTDSAFDFNCIFSHP
jgi:hypothetical protein